jgi:cytochrome P450
VIPATAPPACDVDLFADDVLIHPHPTYAALRERGPAVWLPRHDMWALARHAEVRAALRDWGGFSSASGVGVADEYNARPGGILGSDPPEHDRARGIVQPQLSAGLRRVAGDLDGHVARVVDACLDRATFDAVEDLARSVVASTVADIVGLPADDVRDLSHHTHAAFNLFGAANGHYRDGERAMAVLVDYIGGTAPGRARAGCAVADVYRRLAAGEVATSEASQLVLAFLWPSMDTTLAALANAVHQFSCHPDQWDAVRADPAATVPGAVNEVLRYESPVRLLTRTTTAPVRYDAVEISAGARVALLMAAANRDERRFDSPATFDVGRDAADHVAFGHGIHHCVGAALARNLMAAVLTALAPRVARFDLVTARRSLNNVIRGFDELRVTVA